MAYEMSLGREKGRPIKRDRRLEMGTVLKNAEIANKIFEMSIRSKIESCNPGQFVNVYIDDKSMLLPRPISICELTGRELCIVYRVYGEGTRRLSEYKEGDAIKISSPLGNGYIMREGEICGKRMALVAGGIGIPPMVELAKALKEQGAEVNVFLGYQSSPFLLEKMKKTADNMSIATEDGSAGFCGNVVDMLKRSEAIFDEYYACGPRGMLRALAMHAADVNRPVQVSLEERMGCGYGACLGCACKVKDGGESSYKGVCKHGPVFDGKDVVWDE